MRSPVDFICRPLGGNRYANRKNIGGKDFVVSSDMEDHRYTNRWAEVVQTPTWYDGPICPGDQVVVHHNTFRLFYDKDGDVKSDRPYLKEDTYLVNHDQIYAYRRDGHLRMKDGFCFVEPVSVDGDMVMDMSGHTPLHGRVRYPDSIIKEQGIYAGAVVIFTPDSEYEFEIDDKIMYRIPSEDIAVHVYG